MAEGNWQCGMCAASNESSAHVCMVCDTSRVLGTRSGSGAVTPGDLLAPPGAQEAFRDPRGPAPDTWQGEEPSSGPAGGPPRSRSAPVPRTEKPQQVPPVTGPTPISARSEKEKVSSSTEPLPRIGPEHRVVRGYVRFPRLVPGTWRTLALAGLAAVVLVGAWMWPSGDDPVQGETEESTAPPVCPERIAELIPGGEEGVLVESYRTERHRIVLCSDGVGQLHYFGEPLDGSGEEMVVPAERTEDGYLARAGETVYEIDGTLVVIEAQGEEFGPL